MLSIHLAPTQTYLLKRASKWRWKETKRQSHTKAIPESSCLTCSAACTVPSMASCILSEISEKLKLLEFTDCAILLIKVTTGIWRLWIIPGREEGHIFTNTNSFTIQTLDKDQEIGALYGMLQVTLMKSCLVGMFYSEKSVLKENNPPFSQWVVYIIPTIALLFSIILTVLCLHAVYQTTYAFLKQQDCRWDTVPLICCVEGWQ